LYYTLCMAKKLGRPPKSPDEQLSAIVPVRMTLQERQECELAAQKSGKKLTVWMREKLTRAAKRG